MLTKRIIPCLDIQNGRTVKGINFLNIKDAGDPVELADYYSKKGADELVFLDITATIEKRKTLIALVRDVASAINIPFTVGGGISTVADVSALLKQGADKISINTSAYNNPEIIKDIANEFGSQCVVLAIDTKHEDDGEWYVYLNGGRLKTSTRAIDWALQAQSLGAGEILLTSMNNDGTKNGFATGITSHLSDTLSIPVIASGGAGTMEHFKRLFTTTNADAALAASIFHYREIDIPDLKTYLHNNAINVRL